MKKPEHFRAGKQFIKSMKKLIKRYQEAKKLCISKSDYESNNNMSCLLCHPIGSKKNRTDYFCESYEYDHSKRFEESCTKLGCPWIVMTGMTCDKYTESSMFMETCYQTDNPERIDNRIRQIRHWIVAYKKKLEVQ